MPKVRVEHRSGNGDWETPKWLYDELDAEYHFQLDPCATDANAKCPYYYTEDDNGLAQPWHQHKTVFVNPPYKDAEAWIEKAYKESRLGCTVVILLASRTSNLWWYNWAYKAYKWTFIDKRLKFVGAKCGAPFPSVVLEFRPGDNWPIVGVPISGRGKS